MKRRSDEIIKAALPYIGAPQAYRGFIFGADWADKNPHWISVEVELPMHKDVESENSEIVVVTDGYKRDIGFYNYLTQRWYTVWEDIKITHWTPMPELPKGGER